MRSGYPAESPVRRGHSGGGTRADAGGSLVACGRPAAVHEDVMIVYADAGAVRAFYTDTENHTIPYRVAFSDDKKTVTFVSDPVAAQPRYRLTYLRLDPAHMTIALEAATPDHPDEFKKVIEGRVRKIAQ